MYIVAALGTGTPDLSRREALARAEDAAVKAVSLDDSLADAHAEFGFVRMFGAFDMTTAAAELERAVALDPASESAHGYLASLYEWTEQPALAVVEARRASELNPLSVSAAIELSSALLSDARYEEALEELGQLQAVSPRAHLCAAYMVSPAMSI